jgi:subtilisin family serine protease
MSQTAQPQSSIDGPVTGTRYLVTFPRGHAFAGRAALEALLDVQLAAMPSQGGLSLGYGLGEVRAIDLPSLESAIVLVPHGVAETRLREAAGPGRSLRTAERIGSFSSLPIEDGQPPRGGRWKDTPQFTWNLNAIGLNAHTGHGIRVAILDTGLGPCQAIETPGRTIVRNPIHPWYPGDSWDGNGHGTLCTSMACGGRTSGGRRFGIASDADIYVARVVNASGTCEAEHVLQGLNWAIAQRCHVVSMSLSMQVGYDVDASFEEMAQRALDQNTLIVAAAGNDRPSPVRSPASAPSIMAVGGIDAYGALYVKSSPAGPGPGYEVDLAAPGVNVFVALLDGAAGGPFAYRTGTSLAAPCVAGVAALYFEQGHNARDIWNMLKSRAERLQGLTATDVGSGLVKAP